MSAAISRAPHNEDRDDRAGPESSHGIGDCCALRGTLSPSVGDDLALTPTTKNTGDLSTLDRLPFFALRLSAFRFRLSLSPPVILNRGSGERIPQPDQKSSKSKPRDVENERDESEDAGKRPFRLLKFVRCPRSLIATLATLPSMSLLPFAPFSLLAFQLFKGTLLRSK